MNTIPALQNQGSAFSQLAETKMAGLKKQAESGEYKGEEELKKLAQQFESIFMNQLMKSMRATLPKDGLLSSFSVDMYESMFDQEVAGEMSKGKGMGLADVLYTQLSRMNGTAPGAEENSESVEPAKPVFYAPGKTEEIFKSEESAESIFYAPGKKENP
ncbi:Flagellar protein FlgJ [peptidoglycan hydrolase] [hydrothermal vent metagenome]|uniref:Flagellar protein FlgJ [peptidoglycan hydrolase] n=1 Tax=hydrothermal vent metagenome TaxID=652676 RepID=A0A3B1DNE1_9ZZZZ